MYINHFFTHSASAQLIIAPFENLLAGFNRQASTLLQRDAGSLEKTSVAELFADSLPEFLSFCQRLLDNSQGWSDRLLVTTGDATLRVEAQGCCSVIGEQTLLYLTLTPAEELNKRRNRSNGRGYFLSGANLRNRDPDAYEAIEGQINNHWPANKEALQQLLANQPALGLDVVDGEEFPAAERRSIPREKSATNPTANAVLTIEELKHWERQNLILAITRTEGRIFGPDGAAELVGMKPTTLSAKLKRYGIDRRRFTPTAKTNKTA